MAAITYSARRGLSLLGDEVGAWMADTTAETLVGSERVTNGTFDTDTTGWTATNSAILSIVSGKLRVAYNGATNPYAHQQITTLVGETYQIVADGEYSSKVFLIGVGTTPGGIDIYSSGSKAATEAGILGSFVATGTAAYLMLLTVATSAGYADFDNVSVRLAVPDLSTANNGLGVYGTITKAAVATGADLVGYSSSGGGYAQQPYNSDIDPTTGPLSVSFWIEPATAANENICDHKTSGDLATSGFLIQYRADSTMLLQTRSGASVSNAYSSAVELNGWSSVDVEVNAAGTQIDWYINGSLSTSSTVTARDMSNTAAVTRWFTNVIAAAGFTGRLALPRIATTAQTAAQIKAIYDKEKHLFEPYSHYTQEGVEYSLDVDLSSRGMSRMSDRSENKPIEGPSEVLLFNDWREWDVTTTLRSRSDMGEVAEFLTSALDGRTITFDPYGTVAAPDTPLICQVDQDSFSESETTLGWRQISFKVRET